MKPSRKTPYDGDERHRRRTRPNVRFDQVTAATAATVRPRRMPAPAGSSGTPERDQITEECVVAVGVVARDMRRSFDLMSAICEPTQISCDRASTLEIYREMRSSSTGIGSTASSVTSGATAGSSMTRW